MNQNAQYGAHELAGMNEALMTKSANVELLSFLSHHVSDQRLQAMLLHHAETIFAHYTEGIAILQGQHSGLQYGFQNYQQFTNAAPKLGLRNPSMPSPNMQAQSPSEQSICTVALNIHKFGAIGWTTLALECTNPQFRSFLMAGANMCDKMAYEVWTFMNQKGYYQVPTLQQNTTQTMIHAYQMPSQSAWQPSSPAPWQTTGQMNQVPQQ